MNRADYLAVDAVNWSTLKYVGRSPRHYQHRMQMDDRPDTIYLRLGRLVHALVLEPDTVEERFPVYQGNRGSENPRRAGKFYDQWRAGLDPEATILIPSEWETGADMAAALMSDTAALEALQGVKETPLFWTDEETGLACKAIPDAHAGSLTDLKTSRTDDYGPERFWRTVKRFEYHGQMAHYRAGLEANGFPVEVCRFVVVESTPPYDVAVYRAPEAMLAEGEALRRANLETLLACREDNYWPGATYSQEVELYWPEPIDGGVTFGGVAI